MRFIWLVPFLFGIITLCFGRNNYDVRLESFVGIEGEGETLVDFRGFKVFGRERALNGSAYFAVDLNNEIKVSCKVFTLEVGVWVPMIYEIKRIPVCDFCKDYFLPYVDPKNVATNFPTTAAGYCPLPKGEYWFNKWIPNTEKWVSYMRRGLTKFRMEYSKDDEIIGAFEAVLEVFNQQF